MFQAEPGYGNAAVIAAAVTTIRQNLAALIVAATQANKQGRDGTLVVPQC